MKTPPLDDLERCAADIAAAPHGSPELLRAFMAECLTMARIAADLGVTYAEIGDDIGLEYAIRKLAAQTKAAVCTFADLKAQRANGSVRRPAEIVPAPGQRGNPTDGGSVQ